MTVVQTALWCAVLFLNHASYARADHHKDQTYKRLEVRSNATAAILSTSLHDTPVTVFPTLPPVAYEQDTSRSRNPSNAASGISSDELVASSTKETGATDYSRPGIVVATTDSDDRQFAATEAQDSAARVLKDTFIASITTFARPPLTTRSSLISLTSSAFSTLSLSTTSLNTTSKGWYYNSSTTTISPTTTVTPTPSSTTSTSLTTSGDECTSPNAFATVTSYSIVHTWTITWLGDPADYTPPFPTISTPKQCTPTTSPTGRFTISVCDSSGQKCSLVHTTAAPTASVDPTLVPLVSEPRVTQKSSGGLGPTVTFVTTDKNPAVVFPTSVAPDYGGSPDPAGNVHSAALSDENQSLGTPDYGLQATTDQDIKTTGITEPPPVTVVVKPSVVVINRQTFSDNPAQPTTTVVVDGNSFIIDPTEVIGVDATVTRPPSRGAAPAPSPTPTETTIIGGLSVDVEGGSSVNIEGITFTIGPKPTTVVVKGQTITLGPGGIIFPSQTLTLPSAQDTTQVVIGAELITAIGSDKVFIDDTTITYGPGSPTVTDVIDGDTILIGPSGVVVHGETYGGISAASTYTQYAMVGGATISQVGPTAVVIQGVTFTIGPGQTTTVTTVIGHETITIGPDGVVVSSWTFASPYASTTTIKPSSGAGVAAALPPATATAMMTGTGTIIGTGTGASTGAGTSKGSGSGTGMGTGTGSAAGSGAGTRSGNSSLSPASSAPGWIFTACIATGTGVLWSVLFNCL
ncbi:hypothetical protein F5Y19DRAFT_300723 [Xylariaceae sp. FL1651]|nr:hypothetical protein F5Y19DRAFT_300723 [Xylariaceae sp. FL1651]